jgi:MFS family permease
VTLAFARLSLAGYLLYGFGYVVPLLRRDLGLSESLAGLHATAIAVGIILSGLAGDRFARRLGADGAGRSAVLAVAAAGFSVAFAPHVVVSLVAGLFFGFFAGVVLSSVNQQLSALGGRAASVALARANLSALVATLLAPLAIATLDDIGVGGRLGLLVPLPLIGLIEVANWRRRIGGPPVADLRSGQDPAADRLSGAYWRAWVVLVLVIAIEFSIVFWASSLIGVRTGAGTSEATTAAAAFLLGMIVARAAVSTGLGTRTSRAGVMTFALLLVVVGIVGTWQATSVALSAVALFVAGLGVGPLYPVGVAFSLSLVTGAPEAAAARTTLASGVAILSAPFILAVAAEQVGLVNAWPSLAGIALLAIAMLVLTRADSSPDQRTMTTPRGEPSDRR